MKSSIGRQNLWWGLGLWLEAGGASRPTADVSMGTKEVPGLQIEWKGIGRVG